MKTRKEELMQELEEVRAELKEKNEAIAKEEIAGFKISGVSFYTSYQYINLQHPDFRDEIIAVYNGEIKNLSLASFSIRNTKEPKEVVEAFAKHLEKMKIIENLIQNPERIKKFYDFIKLYYSENVMPLIKKEYQIESEIKKIDEKIKFETEGAEILRMKKELIQSGIIYLIDSVQLNRDNYSTNLYFVFNKSRKLVAWSENRRFVIKDEKVKEIYKQINKTHYSNCILYSNNPKYNYVKHLNRLTYEEYNSFKKKHKIDWQEATREEFLNRI